MPPRTRIFSRSGRFLIEKRRKTVRSARRRARPSRRGRRRRPRSNGTVNVQLLMERLGGGGNHSSAGAQFPHGSVREVEAQALEAISLYQRENEGVDKT